MTADSSGFWKRFWSRICAFEYVLRIVAVLETLFLVLLGYAWVAGVESGSASRQVLVLDLFVVVPTLAVVVWVLRRCGRLEPF